MKRLAFGDVATGVLAVCAIAVTALLVRREFTTPAAQAASPAPRQIRNWRDYAVAGQRIGPPSSAVTIVEFADFQCPFCKQSAAVAGRLIDARPTQITYVYRHYPLGNHPHAMLAAVAAECAGKQGAFRAYHDQLFGQQDSIRKRSWSRLAVDAGITDTATFSRCMSDSAAVTPRIREDMAAASKLGISGTPSLLINDRLISGMPTEDQLRLLVDKK